MKILIDTDILSEVQRKVNQRVHARATAYERDHGPLSASVLTVFEVLEGWHQKGLPQRGEIFMNWLNGCEVLAFVDVGLAATAISQGRRLVTGNTIHFEYVRAAGFELEIENWRDPP